MTRKGIGLAVAWLGMPSVLQRLQRQAGKLYVILVQMEKQMVSLANCTAQRAFVVSTGHATYIHWQNNWCRKQQLLLAFKLSALTHVAPAQSDLMAALKQINNRGATQIDLAESICRLRDTLNLSKSLLCVYFATVLTVFLLK